MGAISIIRLVVLGEQYQSGRHALLTPSRIDDDFLYC